MSEEKRTRRHFSSQEKATAVKRPEDSVSEEDLAGNAHGAQYLHEGCECNSRKRENCDCENRRMLSHSLPLGQIQFRGQYTEF